MFLRRHLEKPHSPQTFKKKAKNAKNMVKKKDERAAKAEEKPEAGAESASQELGQQQMPKLPKEVEEKLKEIKDKLEKFKKKALEKFEDYIVGIALLPPDQPQKQADGEELQQQKEARKEEDKPDSKKINVLVLVDDSESTKMSKEELKEKLSKVIEGMAKEVDENLRPQTLLLTELWQSCYDGKGDLLHMIAMGAPIFDKGMLSAVKIAEIHKTMILRKFEKYIVSYVLAGSLTQGKATPTSDIDVWIVIDDTDVKKMTRAELKDKLRAIIIGMGIEAGEMTGIKNKLNIQVYILTEFWDSLREANPIIFTLLRDGVPFYDRGMFMPWKLMLKMGRIKPSREAIDMFMSSGEQMLQRVKFKLKDIGMEDTYYAILTPSQAALMLYGIPPPTPRETPEMMREVFVKKEGLLEEEYIKILEKNIQLRKDIEHGTKKDLTGKELDELLQSADKFLKRIERLFKQIEKMKEDGSVLRLYDEVVTIIRDTLKAEGIEKAEEIELIHVFEKELIATGKVPARYLRDLHEIVDAKKLFDKGKLGKVEIEKARKGADSLFRFLVEYMQRKRGRELERAKIRVKYGNKFGEVLLLDKTAFVVRDVDAKEQTIGKAPIAADGSIGVVEDTTLEELEHALTKTQFPQRVFIKEPVFERLKELFGKDVEVLVSY